MYFTLGSILSSRPFDVEPNSPTGAEVLSIVLHVWNFILLQPFFNGGLIILCFKLPFSALN